MEKTLESYLDSIDRHLKPVAASERVDIIKEIKSVMFDMEKTDGLAPSEIIERLGDPKALAKAYMGDYIAKDSGYSWRKMCMIIAFYSITGFSGMFVIPILGVLAPGLLICGVIALAAGILKLLGFILHFNVSFITFQIGTIILHPIPAFLLSVVTGILLFLLGRASWKLLICYIRKISSTKSEIFS